MNTDDFLQGQIDCQNGAPHESGKSADYDRGYACAYEQAEMITHFRERGTWFGSSGECAHE